jgi:D-ribose pyranose/furanose isomerase RbsD
MGLNKTDSSRGDAATISGSDAISPVNERDERRVLESQAQVAELAQKLEIATSQAALREQRLASEWKASMQKMQEELANREKATQFAIATTMKSQTESNEQLLTSHMTSAQALMEGFHTIIGQSLVERDARIEMLTASQKAQAEAARPAMTNRL